MGNLRIRSHTLKSPKHQTGVALLLFILVLVLGASTLLVSKLNKASAQYYRDDLTMTALMKAKEALIGYAVSYPDIVNPAFGPGYFSCPDTNGNGSPNPPCGTIAPPADFPVGRLPWEFIGLEDIRDSAGEQLWYAVSDNYRNNPKSNLPMNSELPGQLSLDGANDIVAVIIAPGSSFNGQNRPSNNVNDYLEGDNNNGDANFITNAAGNFNDQVIAITRQELMEVVEKRVLGEVDQTLTTYQVNHISYPWLSTFFDPRSLNTTPPLPFVENVGTTEGHLGVHITNRWFPTTFLVNWNVDVTAPVSTSPDPNPNLVVTDDILNGIGVGPITVDQDTAAYAPSVTGGSECQWTNQTDVRCRGLAVIPLGGGTQRIYDFDISYQNGAVLAFNDPTAITTRTRDIDNPSPFVPGTDIKITVSDNSLGFIETGNNTISGGDTGILFSVSGINYYLDADTPQDLPAWLVENNWHHLIYVAESAGTAPGGAGPCTTPANCLAVNGVSPGNNIDAVVITAGVELSGAPLNQDRTSGLLSSYFDDENLSPLDDTFVRNTSWPEPNLIPAFNDQVRIVAP